MVYRYNSHRLDVEFRRRLTGLEDDTDPGLGGNLGLSGFALSETFTAGEALTAGDICILDGNGSMYKADASSPSLCDRLIGIAATNMSMSDTGEFYLWGTVDLYVFAPGDILYISTTAGELQNYPPNGSGEIVRVVGTAVTSHKLFMNPDRTWLEMR